ncbi:MAG: TVP38/TMEM64 family protein [Halolamina sp.]
MDRWAVSGGLFAAVVVAGAVFTSPSWVLSRAAWLAADPWRLLGALSLIAAVRPFLAWPVTLLAVVAGYGYGLGGVAVAAVLMPLTSVPPYLIARRTGPTWAPGRLRTAGRRAVDVAGGVRGIAASRLLPIPSDVVSVAAGVADVRLVPFVLGSAVGELPWAIAGALAGRSLDRLLRKGLDAVFSFELVGAGAVVGVALLLGPAYEHFVADDADTDTDGGAGE